MSPTNPAPRRRIPGLAWLLAAFIAAIVQLCRGSFRFDGVEFLIYVFVVAWVICLAIDGVRSVDAADDVLRDELGDEL